MDPTTFTILLDFALLVVVTLTAWLLKRSIEHGERLRVVESLAVTTETIRQIVRSENESIHEDIREVKEAIRELAANVSRRRREDMLEDGT